MKCMKLSDLEKKYPKSNCVAYILLWWVPKYNQWCVTDMGYRKEGAYYSLDFKLEFIYSSSHTEECLNLMPDNSQSRLIGLYFVLNPDNDMEGTIIPVELESYKQIKRTPHGNNGDVMKEIRKFCEKLGYDGFAIPWGKQEDGLEFTGLSSKMQSLSKQNYLKGMADYLTGGKGEYKREYHPFSVLRADLERHGYRD